MYSCSEPTGAIPMGHEFLTEKIVITVLLLLFSLVFTFLPWLLHRYMKRATSLMSLLTCLASGVIMGAFFFHILPHIMEAHDHSGHGHHHAPHAHGKNSSNFNLTKDAVPHAHDHAAHDHDHDHSHDHLHDHAAHDHDHDHAHGECSGHSHQPLSEAGSSASRQRSLFSDPFIEKSPWQEKPPGHSSSSQSVGNQKQVSHDHDHSPKKEAMKDQTSPKEEHSHLHDHADHDHSHLHEPSQPASHPTPSNKKQKEQDPMHDHADHDHDHSHDHTPKKEGEQDHSHDHAVHSHDHSHDHSAHSAHDHADHDHLIHANASHASHANGSSHSGHSGHSSHSNYPWGAFCAGASFFFLLIVDRGLMTHNHCPKVGPTPTMTSPNKNEPTGERRNETEASGHATKMEKREDLTRTSDLHDHANDHTLPSLNISPALPIYQSNPNSPIHASNSPIHASNSPMHASIHASEMNPDLDDCQSCHSSLVLGACHMDVVNEQTSKTQAFLFVLVLSIHSFLEGLAMNSNRTVKDLIMFTIALGLHKLLESFALGVSVFKAHFKPWLALSLGIFYSILTPIGILCSLANKNPSPIVEQVLNGLAAGSFLFVATLEMITPEFHKTDRMTPYKLTMASLGFGLMAVVAIMHMFLHAH